MSGIDANNRGVVSRALPQAAYDNITATQRLGRYQEEYVIPIVRKQHALADEGTYFTTNNAQAGLATAAAPTTFSATNPFLLIYNSDSPSNPAYRRIYLDFATLIATAAGTAGASVQAAVTIDSTNRYSSGGTNLTANIVSPNMDIGARSSVANVYAGNITASAASAAARTTVGNRFLKTGIPVVGDQYCVNFGAVENLFSIATATLTFSSQSVAPCIIGPGQSALVHLWLPTQSAASSFIPELAWWER